MLSKGLTPYHAHRNLLAKIQIKHGWVSFAEVELVTDDFMAKRNEVFDEPSFALVNPDTFLSNIVCIVESILVETADYGTAFSSLLFNLSSG